MRLLSPRRRANEVPKHKNSANEVHKDRIKVKLYCKAQEQRQKRLLSTRTSVNDVAKNKGKRG